MFTRFEHPTTKVRTKTIELSTTTAGDDVLKAEALPLTGDTIDGSDWFQQNSAFTTQGLDFDASFQFAGFKETYGGSSKIIITFPRYYRPNLAD